ncbi:MAG TPA: CoA transferase [Paenibacillaceae bacterium]
MYPLEGIRVLDFSWVGAGPFVTKPLADHGAEVIKIESRSRLDVIRSMHPFKDGIPGIDRSGYFANRISSKYSMTLNLKTPKGIEIARELIKHSDVMVNNFSAHVMDKLGLGYEEARKLKPDIIYLSMPMQGATGPHSHFKGYGLWRRPARSARKS